MCLCICVGLSADIHLYDCMENSECSYMCVDIYLDIYNVRICVCAYTFF